MPDRIDRDTALPADLFLDESVYTAELSQIWSREWLYAAPVDVVAEPGSVYPVTVAGRGVVLVRGDDLELRAFANVCRHRGMRLVECASTSSKLVCPYHGWAYRTDGELRSVPYAEADEITKSEFSLAAYSVAQWQGMVFVNLAPEPEPFEQRVDFVDPYVSPLAWRRLYHGETPELDQVWSCNWKAAYIHAIDTYSNFKVHPATIEPQSPTDAGYYLAGSATATVTGGESADRADYLLLALPPSVVVVAHSDSVLVQSFEPLSPDRTRVRVDLATEDPPDKRNGETFGWDLGFIEESRRLCEAFQDGLDPSASGGPLMGIESAIGDFHDYLAWRLVGATPPKHRKSAEPGARPEPQD